jgi:hypothetical protein
MQSPLPELNPTDQPVLFSESKQGALSVGNRTKARTVSDRKLVHDLLDSKLAQQYQTLRTFAKQK